MRGAAGQHAAIVNPSQRGDGPRRRRPLAFTHPATTRRRPRWNHIRHAIIGLADYLHSHDCPIDYRRRRTLDYNSLLTPQIWQRICRDIDIRSGDGKKARLARCHLYATVAGSPARYAPWFIDINDFSGWLANFPVLLTPPLATALDTEAQRFLHEMGIDEPVTWSPPGHLLTGLTLPGADPKDIDLPLLHRLVRRPLALSAIAEQLDTTLDAVRYALTLQPAPERQRGPTSRPSPALTDLAQALSTSALTDLYHGQKLSLKEIGVRYGVERKVVARLAHQYGIQLRPPQRHRQHEEIDRDWLYTEGTVNLRSCGRSANHISLIRHTRPGESPRRTGENRPRIAQVDSATVWLWRDLASRSWIFPAPRLSGEFGCPVGE